jgi:hypothetical protein
VAAEFKDHSGPSSGDAPVLDKTQPEQHVGRLSNGFRHSEHQRIGSGWGAMKALRYRKSDFERNA